MVFSGVYLLAEGTAHCTVAIKEPNNHQLGGKGQREKREEGLNMSRSINDLLTSNEPGQNREASMINYSYVGAGFHDLENEG